MRISWESGITEEQREKVLDAMTKERIAEIKRIHKHKLWEQAQGFVQISRGEIFKQMRRKIVNLKSSQVNERG